MNPNSICAVENEVLRARLKRNKELATEIIYIIQAKDREIRDEIPSIVSRLREIITGK